MYCFLVSRCRVYYISTNHSALLVWQINPNRVSFGGVCDFLIIRRASAIRKAFRYSGRPAGIFKHRISESKPITQGLPSPLDMLHQAGQR